MIKTIKKSIDFIINFYREEKIFNPSNYFYYLYFKN